MNSYLDLHPFRKITIEPKGSIIRLMRILLIVHILIVSFQIPIRAILLDTTYVRDIIPFLLVYLMIGIVSINGSFNLKQRSSLLDKLFLWYIICGIIIFILWVTYGFGFILSGMHFRNHFLPMVLFFIAKRTLTSPQFRIKIINLFLFIAFVYLFSTLIEYLLIKVIGYSPHNIPWYRYTFLHSERFFGNTVIGGAQPYTIAEQTSVLGLMGWQHASAATLMVLFAFSYPYMFQRIKKNDYDYISPSIWAIHFPNWISYFIAFLTFFAIFLILVVTTHMVSFTLILLLFPFLVKGEGLQRNLIIALILVIIVFSNNSFQQYIMNHLIVKFVGQANIDPTIFLLIPKSNLISLIFSQPINVILFGNAMLAVGGGLQLSSLEGSELRLITYTINFGLIWLFLFLSIFITGYFSARKIIKNPYVNLSDRLFAMGTIGFLIVCMLDMGHYARLMNWPILDMFAVCLGGLSSIISQVHGDSIALSNQNYNKSYNDKESASIT